MRRIGTLTGDATANRFCDFLQTKSIEAKAEAGTPAGSPAATPHDIWIRHEQDVVQAQNFLESFQADPTSPQYDVGEEADRIRRKKSDEIARKLELQKKSKMKFRSASGGRGMGSLGGAGLMNRPIPVTIAIIVVATIIAFATKFAQPLRTGDGPKLMEERIYNALSCVEPSLFQRTGDALLSIKQGEVWRLFSPALLHGSPMHLVFNMFNLYILGGVVERIHGGRFYVFLLLICQAAATLTQILLPDWLEWPLAIGASGAVFGVFGFVWIRPKVQLDYPVEIPSFNVKFMLGFLVLCMTGLLGGIANGAHVGGLLTGMLIAVAAPKS